MCIFQHFLSFTCPITLIKFYKVSIVYVENPHFRGLIGFWLTYTHTLSTSLYIYHVAKKNKILNFERTWRVTYNSSTVTSSLLASWNSDTERDFRKQFLQLSHCMGKNKCGPEFALMWYYWQWDLKPYLLVTSPVLFVLCHVSYCYIPF